MTVRPVGSRREMEEFLRLPWRIYQGDRCWVPPIIAQQKELLDRSRHPFHRHAEVEYFLARQQGDVVGRVAAILNHRHNEFHQERVGFFGFFECVPSQEVASALIDAASAWVKERGMAALRGPANFSSNEEWGLLVEGFDRPPVLMMTYNPRYYPGLLEGAGLAKAKDILAWYALIATMKKDQLRRLAERLGREGQITLRPVDMKRFDAEVDLLKGLYNRAWSRNWGFVPMTDEEFRHMARHLKDLVVPDLVLIACVKGDPAGFALTLPDYNRAFIHINGRLGPWGTLKFLWYARKIHFIRTVAMGVVPEHLRKGVDALLILGSIERGLRKGVLEGELSWTLEDNKPINNTFRSFGLQPYKRYRIYEKVLP